MLTDDFDYDLPPELIAQRPLEERDAARLLVDDGAGSPVAHRHVRDLPAILRRGDVLVVNDTRVLPARVDVRRRSGGRGEVLFLARRPGPAGWWEALVRPSRKVASGEHVSAGDVVIQVGEDLGAGLRLVRLLGTDSVEEELAALHTAGTMPLPPYVHERLEDPERYQTVYARRPGSAAAPTAGLHLTTALLDATAAVGVTIARVDLAVGLATFRPMVTDRVEDHVMHAEAFDVPEATRRAIEERPAGARVVAVGTTTLRALESWGADGRPSGSTELFVRRGFHFTVTDVLLTNFHLPRSSLLVLVDAFVGPRWRDLYGAARHAGYRFLSFGDAMLLTRSDLAGDLQGGGDR